MIPLLLYVVFIIILNFFRSFMHRVLIKMVYIFKVSFMKKMSILIQISLNSVSSSQFALCHHWRGKAWNRCQAFTWTNDDRALWRYIITRISREFLSLYMFSDLFFKILLFQDAFLIFHAILLFLFTFFWLVCYYSMWFYFSPRNLLNIIRYFINWCRVATSTDKST